MTAIAAQHSLEDWRKERSAQQQKKKPAKGQVDAKNVDEPQPWEPLISPKSGDEFYFSIRKGDRRMFYVHHTIVPKPHLDLYEAFEVKMERDSKWLVGDATLGLAVCVYSDERGLVSQVVVQSSPSVNEPLEEYELGFDDLFPRNRTNFQFRACYSQPEHCMSVYRKLSRAPRSGVIETSLPKGNQDTSTSSSSAPKHPAAVAKLAPRSEKDAKELETRAHSPPAAPPHTAGVAPAMVAISSSEQAPQSDKPKAEEEPANCGVNNTTYMKVINAYMAQNANPDDWAVALDCIDNVLEELKIYPYDHESAHRNFAVADILDVLIGAVESTKKIKREEKDASDRTWITKEVRRRVLLEFEREFHLDAAELGHMKPFLLELMASFDPASVPRGDSDALESAVSEWTDNPSVMWLINERLEAFRAPILAYKRDDEKLSNASPADDEIPTKPTKPDSDVDAEGDTEMSTGDHSSTGEKKKQDDEEPKPVTVPAKKQRRRRDVAKELAIDMVEPTTAASTDKCTEIQHQRKQEEEEQTKEVTAGDETPRKGRKRKADTSSASSVEKGTEPSKPKRVRASRSRGR